MNEMKAMYLTGLIMMSVGLVLIFCSAFFKIIPTMPWGLLGVLLACPGSIQFVIGFNEYREVKSG